MDGAQFFPHSSRFALLVATNGRAINASARADKRDNCAVIIVSNGFGVCQFDESFIMGVVSCSTI